MRLADLPAGVGMFLATMALTLTLAGAAQPPVKPAPVPAPTATPVPPPKPGATVAMPGSPGADAADATDKPQFPTTQFAPNARTASVSDGDMTATITMMRRADIDPDADVPLLEVFVAGKKVIEAAGIDSDSDEPAAEASIVEMDASNQHKEVYFSSYSGGCCSTVIVAEEVGDHWESVPVGDFDGDGGYLKDLDGDGIGEIATVDINFINRFDCTACSAAPRVIYTVKAGNVVDLTTDTRFLGAHRAWLKEIEDSVDPDQQWKSPGYLAGWLGEKIRLGEGAAAWQAINAHWDSAHDPGEAACPNGDDPDQCDKKDRKVLKFPERLRLFLDNAGYKF
jgi:hypothetical protein